MFPHLLVLVLSNHLLSHLVLSNPDFKLATRKCDETTSCKDVKFKSADWKIRNCKCDPMCSIYGDCCLDLKYDMAEQRRLLTSFRCIKFDAYEEGIYMKTTCPPGWEDNQIKDRCESLEPLENHNDPLLTIPATNVSSNITYRNVYCAYCHQDSMSDLWNIELECPTFPVSNSYNITRNNIGEYITFNETNTNKCGMFINKTFYPCSMYPRIPKNILPNVRRCQLDTVTTCAVNWTNVNVRNHCESYTSIVFNGKVGYRNPHCAICNNISLQNLRCTKRLQKGTATPFSILFNFTAYKFVSKKKLFHEYQTKNSFFERFHEILYTSHKIKCLQIELDNKFDPYMIYVTFIGLGISIIFLVLHLTAFMLLPELRNLSGKILACLCLSLLVSYSTFMSGQVLEGMPCYYNALVMYYCFLASFFWMLTIAFDIWRTLRLATTKLRVSAGKQWRKFTIYSLWSWTAPGIILASAIYIDTLPSDAVPADIRPDFGKYSCWFGQPKALIIFFAAPVTITMFLNIIFFVSSAQMVYSSSSKTRLTVSVLTPRDFRIYIRLALVMGITWTTGLIAGTLDIEGLWYVFIALNTLQGLFIFLAFTCTNKVIRSLVKRLDPRALSSLLLSWSGASTDSTRKSHLGSDHGHSDQGVHILETQEMSGKFRKMKIERDNSGK